MELQIQSLLQEAEYIGDDGVGGGEGVGVSEDVKYLRKQYFLLNEDFQRPLRKGLQGLLRTGSDENLICIGRGTVVSRFYDTAVGYKVQIKDHSSSLEELLPGSLLVLLSRSSGFRLEPESLVLCSGEQGSEPALLRVQVLDGQLLKDVEYSVYKYTVYLEAYKHHLNILKNMKNCPGPLPRYIINSGKDPKILEPEYLSKTETLSLNCLKYLHNSFQKSESALTVDEVHKLLLSKHSSSSASSPGSSSLQIFKASGEYKYLRNNPNLKTSCSETPVINNFPKREPIECQKSLSNQSQISDLEESQISDLEESQISGLEKSQAEALKNALTQEVSLIQGPPGTGKSFLGSLLVQVLLENRSLWTRTSSTPVLVICYTNAALDEFLESGLRYTRRIVRLGSRSKSDLLENYTLNSILGYRRDAALRNQGAYWKEKELRSALHDLNLRLAEQGSASSEDISLHHGLIQQLRSLTAGEGRLVCQGADIIGTTCTGAAKHRQLLHQLNPKIVLVEEAGEMMESQLIASIPPSSTHIIMIGDHQQLRPQVGSPELAKSESHDISLFERLIICGFPFSCLLTQHRMVPLLSSLLSPIYPGLRNHPEVERRGRIPGLVSPLFFINHLHAEHQSQGGSRTNKFEAEFCVALVQYLVLQGIQPSRISVLTPYSAQYRLIVSLYPVSRTTVSTVDNYQGKENDIVILSLVRVGGPSVGFLATENRISVALSRARDVLIILGNLEELASASKLWTDLEAILRSRNLVGQSLPVCCQPHGSVTQVSSSSDLQYLQNGGCGEMCEIKMACGHTCLEKCHGGSIRHCCGRVCSRSCNKGHPCSKLCGEDCGECSIRVEVKLQCGHLQDIPCYQRTELAVCSVVQVDSLSCGHSQPRPCGTSSQTCSQICSSRLECGHECSLLCHPISTLHTCTKPCPSSCVKGHPCSGLCGEVCKPCSHPVQVLLPCSHLGNLTCSEDLEKYECTEKCSKILDCGHNCRALCYEDCDRSCRFRGQLVLPCGHSANGRCGDPPACSNPCPLLLLCGHPCQESCGALCTTKCKEPVSITLISGTRTEQSRSCSHTPVLLCHAARARDQDQIPECKEVCFARLCCGHLCSGICSECKEFELHLPCVQACTRTLLCGHPCTSICGQPCPPCKLNSLIRCPHVKAKNKCDELPKPCKEKCEWKCEHKKCTKKCSLDCNRTLCEEKCRIKLKCGHLCTGYCGELCLCTVCSGSGEGSGPWINLGCGCALTYPVFKPDSSETEVLKCPKCNTQIFFSPLHKKELYERLSIQVEISDLLFSFSTRVEERRNYLFSLVSGIERPEVKLSCENILGRLEPGGVKLKSMELNMVELQVQVLGILEQDPQFRSLSRRISSFRSFSADTLRELLKIIGSRNNDVYSRLESLQILSYESGLWKYCRTCQIIYKLSHHSCKQGNQPQPQT